MRPGRLSICAAVIAVGLSLGLPGAASAALGSAPDALPVTDGTVRAEAVNGTTLYIGGDFDHVAMATGPAAEFAAADGSLVAFPAVSGGFAEVTAAVSDGAGGWYIAGVFTRVGGLARSGLAHVLAGGTVDPEFVPPAFLPAGSADAVILSLAVSGTTLYVGGSFASVGGVPRQSLAALDATDGSVEHAFTADLNPEGVVERIVATPSTLYVGGDFDRIGGTAADAVAAIDPTTGQPIAGFAAPITAGSVDGLALAGATLYISGSFDETPASPAAVGSPAGVAALDAGDGHLITGFAPPIAAGGAIAVTPSAVYVVTPVDSETTPPTQVVALDPGSGALVPGFKAVADGRIYSLQALDGSLYLGGEFTQVSGASRRDLAAVDPVTGVATATTFDPNGTVATLAAGDSDLLAGGGFQSVRGTPRRDLAAIDLTSGDVLPGFDPEPDGPVSALDLDGGALYVGGQFSQIASGARTALAALDPASGALLPFDAQLADAQNAPDVEGLTGNGSQLYVSGQFDHVGTAARANLAEVDESDAAATAFAPDLDGAGGTVLLDGGTVYVGGSFTLAGGRPHAGVVAVDAASGAADPAFDAEVDGDVGSLALSGSTLYLGGDFDHVDQLQRHGLAAVDAATGAVLPFDPEVYGQVDTLALDGGELEVAGSFEYLAGVPRTALAELAPDGTPASFDPQLGGNIYDLALAPGGSLVAGGLLLSADRGPVEGLAEFSPSPVVAAGDLTSPSVSGIATLGATLTCNPGTWPAGVDLLRYNWLTDGAFDSESSGPTLSLAAQDEGHDLQCEVTGESPGGSVSAISPAIAVPGPVPAFDAVSGTILAPAGQLAAGQYLVASEGEWFPSPSAYDLQWQRCDADGANCQDIAGATEPGYRLSPADVGATIQVVVTALDDAGASAPVTSGLTDQVPSGLPQTTSPPAIYGLADEGDELEVEPGTWTQAPTSYQYQWERCSPDGTACQPIEGATSSVYDTAAADLGDTLVAQVTAVNGYGAAATLPSPPSNVIYSAAQPPPPPSGTLAPTIGGIARTGATLTADPGGWTQGPSSFAYQWQRCSADGSACGDIPDADLASYTTRSTDAGDTLRVAVVATNSGGPSAASTSAAFGPIAEASAGQPPSPNAPIATTPQAGATPTAPNTARSPPTPPHSTSAGARPSPPRLIVALSTGPPSALTKGSLTVHVRCSAAAEVRIELTESGHEIAVSRRACGPRLRAFVVRVSSTIARRLLRTPAKVILSAQATATDGRRSAPVRRTLPTT